MIGNISKSKGFKGDRGDTPVRGTDYWTEDDKTEIINEVKDMKKPDWNQNDETADDYVKNRTHYEHTKTEEISVGWYSDMPVDNLGVVNWISYPGFATTVPLVNGEVLVNLETGEDVVVEVGEDGSATIEADTYLVEDCGDGTYGYTSSFLYQAPERSGTYARYSRKIKTIVPLDKKYLPDGIEYISNKTTTISKNSTDEQYPSAKATYDAIKAMGGTGGGSGVGASDVGEHSEIFNDYESNNAYGEYSHSSGYGSTSGVMGYYFTKFVLSDDKLTATLYLSTEQSAAETEERDLNFTIKYAVGDVISYVYGSKFLDIATITTIDTTNQAITVEAVSGKTLGAGSFDTGVDDQIVYVYAKPDVGLISFGHYAHAEGEQTIAIERASHAEGRKTIARGQYGHAEGRETKAGYAAHGEGYKTEAMGNYSHAENDRAKASGLGAHAEGQLTKASGNYSHAEGAQSIASGNNSHSEGSGTKANGTNSHTEGYHTTVEATGNSAHAEGYESVASGTYGAHAEGMQTTASGESSHAEGRGNTSSGKASHTEGMGNTASEEFSHAEGRSTEALGTASHAEGNGTHSTGAAAHAEGYNTTAEGGYSHAEGQGTQAIGGSSHTEGFGTAASGSAAHAEGYNTLAEGNYSHAEGSNSQAIGTSSHAESGATASGDHSHAEGTSVASGRFAHAEGNSNTEASGYAAHAEGHGTKATGEGAHSEGLATAASGKYSHAEGWGGMAVGLNSHAEGKSTQANGEASHAEGHHTIANGNYQHVEGKLNKPDNENKYIHIAGNGTSGGNESNAYTLDWEGNGWFAGTVEATAVILNSPGGKRFKITVDDSGDLTTAEIT